MNYFTGRSFIVPIPFHNPYNFIRTPDRESILKQAYAGDHDPTDVQYKEDHSRYWPGRYTGTIPVRLRTQTPLFITAPQPERKDGNGHRTYDCLEYIPATALKGMLSSAYEIITNSRYRVFKKDQHDKRLGYRSQVRANLVPGRVEEKSGQWTITLFTGTSSIGKNGPKDSKTPAGRGPLYAAWIPLYRRDHTGWSCPPAHGLEVRDVTLRLYDHGNFKFWSVVGNLPQAGSYKNISYTPVENTPAMLVNGYVVVTGKIFQKKHDERFFFNTDKPIVRCLNGEVRRQYEELVADYKRVHEKSANPPIGGTAQGGHITDPFWKLKDGSFVYAKTDGHSIEAIYPVQISRELYEASPWDCLDETLRPAERLEQLSPADRLFGWVPQEGKDSWKGKIRVSNGIYTSEENSPVEKFQQAKSLAILGEPKPAQARFYLGDKDGSPQANGISKEDAGYARGKKIRGRKIYLHHQNFSETKVFPDIITKSNQNRSITGWIPAKREFSFEIKFENLTPRELGGLLTLLKLETGCYFRLGYGKPLGMGSVQLEIDNRATPRIFDGAEMGEHYKQFSDCSENISTIEERGKLEKLFDDCLKIFKDGIGKAYPLLLEKWVQSLQSVQGRVAYSVTHNKDSANQPVDNAPIYDWFVQNENGTKCSLPAIGETLESYAPSSTLQKQITHENENNQRGHRRR
jgi:CRISPR-associated protein (TIGR03986 family)